MILVRGNDRSELPGIDRGKSCLLDCMTGPDEATDFDARKKDSNETPRTTLKRRGKVIALLSRSRDLRPFSRQFTGAPFL